MQGKQEVWVRSLGWEDPLEEDTATHSGVLAWRISWTEEAGGLQSIGSQRVGNNLSHMYTCPDWVYSCPPPHTPPPISAGSEFTDSNRFPRLNLWLNRWMQNLQIQQADSTLMLFCIRHLNIYGFLVSQGIPGNNSPRENEG